MKVTSAWPWISGAAPTLRVSGIESEIALVESFTRNTRLEYVPPDPAAGVPEISPVVALSDNPDGSDPEPGAIDHV